MYLQICVHGLPTFSFFFPEKTWTTGIKRQWYNKRQLKKIKPKAANSFMWRMVWKKNTARGYLARVLSAPDSSRLCSLFPATHLGVYVSRSALLWGGSNPGSDCWEQLSRRKDLWEASWVAGQGLRFSSSSRPSLACATLPMPGLMSRQGGTCQVTADLPGGHQTAPNSDSHPWSHCAPLVQVPEVPALPCLAVTLGSSSPPRWAGYSCLSPTAWKHQNAKNKCI